MNIMANASGVYSYITHSLGYYPVPFPQKTPEAERLEAKQLLEELDFDPLYGMISLGIVHFKAAREIHYTNNPKPQVKIYINRCTIESRVNGVIQRCLRTLCPEAGRAQLSILRKHIIKALQWFPPHKSVEVQLINQFAAKGLETLYNTYKPESAKVAEEPIGRALDNDKILIQSASAASNDRELAQIFSADELTRMFPLSNQPIRPNEAGEGVETRDQMMERLIKALWLDDSFALISGCLSRMDKLITKLNGKKDEQERRVIITLFDRTMQTLENFIIDNPPSFSLIKDRIKAIDNEQVQALARDS
jgi:hypothetical protein